MGLFDRKKEAKSCCCGAGFDPEAMAQAQTARAENGVKVLAELHMDTAVGHVTDFSQIAAYGVMTTPALVVDGKVVSCGKALNKDEVKALLEKARGGAAR